MRCFVAVLVCTLVPSLCVSLPWASELDKWDARTHHGAVALHNGDVLVLGGMTTLGRRNNDVWRSSDGGSTWYIVCPNAAWRARMMHSAVVLPNGDVLVIAGETYFDRTLNDVWRSSDNGATWFSATNSAPWGRRKGQSSLALRNGDVLVLGGDTGVRHLKNDVWSSSDDGATWYIVTANAPWSPRACHSTVELPNGDILVLGGWNARVENDVWRSSDGGATWYSATTNAPWRPRSFHSTTVLRNGDTLVLGGSNSWTVSTNDVWCSHDGGATWRNVTMHAPWTVRNGHGTVTLPNGDVLVLGGRNRYLQSDVWRSSNGGATWYKVSPWP